MRLHYYLCLGLLFVVFSTNAQIIPISSARALPLGSTVTVNGIVTGGSEFGSIRYMQDGTAGIAIFSTAVAALERGDNTTVEGVTVEFSNLLEIAPVNNFSINSSSNPEPTPINLSPSQMGESNESMLVRVANVTFSGSGNFQGSTNYNFTSNGESGVVYIRSSSPLIGQPIPTSNVIVTGICSQFGNQYQLLPRNMNDFVFASIIAITSGPIAQNITTTGFDVNWQTDMNGNSFLRYGLTPALELGTLTGPVNTSNPTVNISGGSPAKIYYAQAFTVAGTDTAFSGVKVFITKSNSSGSIKAYFSREISASAAIPPSNIASYIPNAFDDTLKAYIDRSNTTLDIAIYNIDATGSALITQAINDAYNRGVRVRMVVEVGNANAGLQNLNPAIPINFSPGSSAFYYGIMHHKFFIIDAEDANPNIPVVMTGSTNWTNSQLNSDRNNLVFFQDQSMARVYQIEFEEMWGGSGALPDTANDRFGPDKLDNTPHQLNIGGKLVEVFFSPSDNTNEQIARTIQTADTEMYFATMVYTKFDLAYVMEDRYANHGVFGAGIVNDSSGNTGISFQIIQGVIGNNMMLYNHPLQTGIMHHKYMIVDQSNNGSDPLVLTGSHNWSASATQRNDENTVIIHDPLIANQYYQEFHFLFNSNGGALSVAETVSEFATMKHYPNPTDGNFTIEFNSPVFTEGSLIISDISGRVVMNRELILNQGMNKVEVEQLGLTKGIYLLQMNNSTGSYNSKIVVQ